MSDRETKFNAKAAEAVGMVQAQQHGASGAAEIARQIPSDQDVLIAGPTASGKSALALEIARQGGGVIVNADALQVYSCFRVLTARPSQAEEDALPHALYGHLAADEEYSVGQWLRDVFALPRHQRLIITGGTGLYFSALTEGLAEAPPTTPELRARSNARIAEEGVMVLLDELRRNDTMTASRIDTANPRRVQRAWEVLEATGKGLAAWQDETPPPLMPLAGLRAFVIDAPRDWLAARAETRFDVMLEGGALEEVRALLPDWRDDLPALKAIGARELGAALRGERSLDDARAEAVIATRRYIKRQQSWLRSHMTGWQWLDARNLGEFVA